MTDRYVVAGNPVAHSLSPLIHTEFARQCGEDLRYDTLLVPSGEFARVAGAFFRDGGRGMNVTVPCKEDACRFADELRPAAAAAGAVNTLWTAAGRVVGDNTDGIGLLRDLSANLDWPLAGARILILGAGGATRGILAPLLAAGPSSVTLANRTAPRAEALREQFRALAGAVPLEACGLDGLRGAFDLLIHATSAGLDGTLPALPPSLAHSGSAAYDLMYARDATPFLRWAQSEGIARRADGLGMLVEQAAEAYLLWRGSRPQTAGVLAMLRDTRSARA